MFDPTPRFPSLPGTTPAPCGLFVDRWGTLLEPPAAGYARTPEEVLFYPGAVDALFRASRAGWRIYLLGNEDAVAQGKLSDAAWEAVASRFLDELRKAGVLVARQYECLDHPQGVPPHQADSVYLLPNTGAFYHATHVDGVELANSWVIGDSTLELAAGWRSGCHLAAVRTGLALSDATFEVHTDIDGADLVTVIDRVLSRYERLSA